MLNSRENSQDTSLGHPDRTEPIYCLIECVRRLLKEVIHGHFVLYQVIVVVVGNTISCNHNKVYCTLVF